MVNHADCREVLATGIICQDVTILGPSNLQHGVILVYLLGPYNSINHAVS